MQPTRARGMGGHHQVHIQFREGSFRVWTIKSWSCKCCPIRALMASLGTFCTGGCLAAFSRVFSDISVQSTVSSPREHSHHRLAPESWLVVWDGMSLPDPHRASWARPIWWRERPSRYNEGGPGEGAGAGWHKRWLSARKRPKLGTPSLIWRNRRTHNGWR